MSMISGVTPKRETVAEIKGEETTVSITEIITPCGTRIEISSLEENNQIRLDPLELESLTWQSPESLHKLLAEDRSTEVAGLIQSTIDDATEDSETVRISNEFADVKIQKSKLNGTEVLNISSPKLDYGTNIPAVVLNALTAHDTTLFSEFLKTPFGPRGEAGHDH